MSEYFDCILFKKTKNDKTFAVKLGTAKKRDDGGFNVYLDALPTGDGSFAIVPQRDKAKAPAARNDDMEDNIPF